jgi:hypothetical protein
MTIPTWPEQAHDFTCCQDTPWDDPDPGCCGKTALERKEAA